MYGEVPPLTDAVQDTDCSNSILVPEGQLDKVGVDGGVYADTTVRVPDLTLLVVSGVVALSVIITFACSVFPARFEGIVQANEFEVPETPVKSMFATRLPDIVFTMR